MRLDNPKQAEEFLDSCVNMGRSVAQAVAARIAINRCMYEGAHWINGGFDMSANSTIGRRLTNWNPETPKLVATQNQITKLIHETSAASYPDKLEAEVVVGGSETGIEAALHAQVKESALNAMIDFSGYLEAARTANFRRCVDGTHGIGWGVTVRPRQMPLRNGGEETVYDQVLKAFTFDSMKLTLDPGVQELDLWDHEWVIYSDVWSLEKIKRNLGIELKEDDCQTMGELLSMEMQFNQLSQNRLYTNLPTYSKTKGARVHQIHAKDEAGTFSTMLIGVKTPDSKMQWANWDNQESPFGGQNSNSRGLPFTLLHGYRRPDSMWSISDVAMLKDDQDRLNLLATMYFRMLQRNASFQWLVDKSTLDENDPDGFRNQFNNYVGGLITYKAGTRDRPSVPPQLVRYPDPPQWLQDGMSIYQGNMREQVHRPDITAGATKSHVTNTTYQTANRNANQVLGGRAREDIGRHQTHLMTGLGTVVKMAQQNSPSILAELTKRGFEGQEFAVLAQTDPAYPACEIRIRDSSIKFQSKEEKEQRLWAAADRQAISATDLRLALADMDTPLNDDDRAFLIEARKAAERIIMGEIWVPAPLGQYTEMFINAFRRARFDKRADADQQARARLDQAIQDQMSFDVQMQMEMQAPQAAGGAGAQPAQPMPSDEVNEADLTTLLRAIESSAISGSVPAGAGVV